LNHLDTFEVRKKMSTTECPNCDMLIDVRSPIRLGDMVKCSVCSESLVVIWTDPLELDWPYDDEDDEDYSWDEDYEIEEESW
jgi:uncharacterized paraquat-inducible protein A